MSSLERFVGINASAEKIEAVIRPFEENRSVEHDDAGIHSLIEHLHALYPTLVVLQSDTQNNEDLKQALKKAKLPVINVNQRQLQNFLAQQTHSKGIQVDNSISTAEALAQFGQAIRPKQPHPNDEQNQELRILLSRRLQLIEMLMAEKNRLMLSGSYSASELVEHNIHQHIDWLESALEDIDIHLQPFWLIN